MNAKQLQESGVFFDRSHGAVTVYQLNPASHVSDAERLKCAAVAALEEARFARNSGVVLEVLQQSKESSVGSFDGWASPRLPMDMERHLSYDAAHELSDEVFFQESAGKKLEVLAGMVGVESLKPEVVLAEVVRILKCLGERERLSSV